MDFTVVNAAEGRIKMTVRAAKVADASVQLGPGDELLAGAFDPGEYWLDGLTPIYREELLAPETLGPFVVGVATAVALPLPSGVTAIPSDGLILEPTADGFSITPTDREPQVIRLESARHRPASIVVATTDPADEAVRLRTAVDGRAFALSRMPILHKGDPFDADALARERIRGVIDRLRRGDGLPTAWQGWRDADNAYHWEQAGEPEVLEELSALSKSIEDREQDLLVCAWTHKAAIDGLLMSHDYASLYTYDVTANWPLG